MSLRVFYTPRSKETLASVYMFILEKFGKASADKFASKAEKTIALIAEHPFMFKSSVIEANIRVGIISKQCSLFYKVNDDSIHLLFFWDNRQDPVFL